MKTYKNLYAKICSFDNLLAAAKQAAAGKRFRTYVLRFTAEIEDHVLQLQRELQQHSYEPGEYHSFYIHRPKHRMISAAPFRDRVVHHALINVIGPLFERRFIFDSYANRLGKGTHAAIKRLQAFMRRARHVLKCDLQQYFPSIDHELLKQQVRLVIGDHQVLWLIDKIIDCSNPQIETNWYFPGDDLFSPFERRRGLPIGNLTSQFLANVYLDRFDHFVKEKLRCRFYLRYVDDFVILDDSAERLRALLSTLQEFLDTLRLRLNAPKCQVRPVICGQRFLGQIVFPTHRFLAPENVRSFAKRVRGLQKRYEAGAVTLPNIKQSLMSWLGHAGQANTWRLRAQILPRLARFG